MTLQVSVMARSPLPVVRVVIDEVPAGSRWTLVGHAEGVPEWLVADGESTGSPVVTADPWAPLGIPASYRLTFDATVQQAGPVLRTFDGWAAITDLTGRTVAAVEWVDGDPLQSERRAHFSAVPGSRYSPTRLDPVAGAGGGTVNVIAARPAADALQALLESNDELILLHNEQRCQIPGCVVAPTRTIYVTSDPNDLTERIDVGEREWSLRYQLTAPGVRGGVVPVVTFDDVAAFFPTFTALAASGMTFDDLARGDWLTTP